MNAPTRDPMFDTRRYYCPVCREWFNSTITHDCPHCGSEDLRLICVETFPHFCMAWFDSDDEYEGVHGYGQTPERALDNLITEYIP